MSYLSIAKKRKRNPLKKILLLVFVCILIGFLGRSLIVKTVVGIESLFDSVFSFVAPGGFRAESNIITENKSLRESVLMLTALNADRAVLADENANLKFELGRKYNTPDGSRGVLAIIKSSPGETPFDTFIVDIGADDGISVGQIAYFGNLAVGKVVDLGSHFAKVKLFSSPGNIFAGTISGLDIKIDAKGLGGGVFEVLIPEAADVEVGDILILPSISSKVFGVVSSIEDKPEEGFKRLLFNLPVNPNQISQVLIW